MNKKIWIAATAVVVLAIAGGVYWNSTRKAVVVYREFPVTRGNLTESIFTTGTVQPQNRLSIKPPIAGRVERVLVPEGAKVKRGQILAWMSSTERAALLDAARAEGPAEVKRWEELYKPTPLLAPINGTIILRSVEPGQTFSTTEAVMVLSDRLTVKAQVDETDMSQVALKQTADITLDAFASVKIPAKVAEIAFEAVTTNNVTVYLVDVIPDETPDFMRAGMTASVTFFVKSKEDIILVSNEALGTGSKGNGILVKGTDGKPVERTIEIGFTDGKSTEVISGLSEGEIALLPSTTKDKNDTATNPFAPGRPGRRSR